MQRKYVALEFHVLRRFSPLFSLPPADLSFPVSLASLLPMMVSGEDCRQLQSLILHGT